MNSAGNPIAALVGDEARPIAVLVSQYAEGPAELHRHYSGLAGEQLVARPVPGRWSLLEVLCHLADCEQFFADRIKRTLAMERPLLMGADGGNYPVPLHYHQRDAQEELLLITLTRAQVARIVGLIAPEAWERQAVHSEAGLMTVRALVRHAINHQAHHLRFVEEKRRALGLA